MTYMCSHARRNVGFLHYFELKQLPNFLLAAPILLVSASCIWHFVAADPLRFVTLGFRCTTSGPALPSQSVRVPGDSRRPVSAATHNCENDAGDCHKSTSSVLVVGDEWFASSPLMLPHVYLYTFLVLIATFVMHVQVATRFLATMPVLYWWLADRLVRLPVADECMLDKIADVAVEALNAPSATSVEHNRRLRNRLRSRKHQKQDRDETKQYRTSSPSPQRSNRLRTLRPVGDRPGGLWEPAVLNYFAAYCVVGCALFSNYYPWT